MLNILDVDPKITSIPTYPLRRAAERLKEAAENAHIQEAQRRRQEEQGRRIRNRYILSKLPGEHPPPPPLPHPPSLDRFILAIDAKIEGTYGRYKGPSQNALAELDRLARRALKAGYPLNNLSVQTKFLNFLMAYVTEGFKGVDTTGTQMGNFKGEWRGGGFKE